MSKVDLIFLHGFLGTPTDWDQVIQGIKLDLEGTEVQPTFLSLDYFNCPNLSPKNAFEKVSADFVNTIESGTSNSRKILIGYSLGGRLALHIFEKKPDLFERLICVSTNPGIKASQIDELAERHSRDQFWSELFLNHDWREVVTKWNEQDVFTGSVNEPVRDSNHFRRDLLAKALVNWSLAKQTDKRILIRKFPKKITMVVGDKDKKFIELNRSLLKEIPDIGIKMIPSAGHRVLFDNPLELAHMISSSVATTKKK